MAPTYSVFFGFWILVAIVLTLLSIVIRNKYFKYPFLVLAAVSIIFCGMLYFKHKKVIHELSLPMIGLYTVNLFKSRLINDTDTHRYDSLKIELLDSYKFRANKITSYLPDTTGTWESTLDGDGGNLRFILSDGSSIEFDAGKYGIQIDDYLPSNNSNVRNYLYFDKVRK